MPPSTEEVIKTILSVMATTEDFSWILYVAALFQSSIAVCILFRRFRNQRFSVPLIVVSLLILPTLLGIGIHYTTQPI